MPRVLIHTKGNGSEVGYTDAFGKFHDFAIEYGNLTYREQELAIIHRILFEQRQYARDHSQSDSQFRGAALIKTKKGNWFVHSNIHLHNAEISRNCAEANAITEAYATEGKDLEVADLYFMGGNTTADGKDRPDQRAQRHSPCGSCRGLIHNHQPRGGETLIHLLPLNDDHIRPIATSFSDKRPIEALARNEIFTRPLSHFNPHLTLHADNRALTAQRGYEWIQSNASSPHPKNESHIAHALESLAKLEGRGVSADEKMHAINKLLMNTAKDYYHDALYKPYKLSVAIVRSTNGKFYLGKYARGHDVMATPTATFEAIGRAIDASLQNKITDVFFVEFDFRRTPSLLGSSRYEVRPPGPATREIIKKASVNHSTAQQATSYLGTPCADGAFVHVFTPNDPSDDKGFSLESHVFSNTIHAMLPYGFRNPKSEQTALAR